MCSFRTKRLSCKFFQGRNQCSECERYAAELEYSHADLYYQMKFFKFIFDTETFKNYYKDDSGKNLDWKLLMEGALLWLDLFFCCLAEIVNVLRGNKEMATGLNQLKEYVNKSLRNNTYGIVDLDVLFRNF